MGIGLEIGAEMGISNSLRFGHALRGKSLERRITTNDSNLHILHLLFNHGRSLRRWVGLSIAYV